MNARQLNYPIFLLLMLATAGTLCGQGIPSNGREYFIGYVPSSFSPPLQGSAYREHSLLVNLTSPISAHVTISYVGDDGTDVGSRSVQLAPNVCTTVSLDLARLTPSDTGETPEHRTCHIVSNAPVSVVIVSNGPCRGGSYLALPIECLGRKYVAMSYNDDPLSIGAYIGTERSAGAFEVIAVSDATLVSITPTVATVGGKPGVSGGVGTAFTVILNRGQSYYVKSSGIDGSNDISGSLIEASKPVAVFSGHGDAFTQGSAFPDPISEGGPEARNALLQQLPPVECYDTGGFYTIPWHEPGGVADGSGDELRVLTSNDGPSAVTLFTVQPLSLTAYPLALQPAALPGIMVPSAIWSTNGVPVMVGMYDQRRQTSPGPHPSADMMWVVPRSRWASEYLISPSVPGDASYLDNRYFISLICRQLDWNSGLLVSVDNAAPVTVAHSGLAIKKIWSGLPGAPELVGVELEAYFGRSYHFYNIKGVDSLHPDPAPFGLSVCQMHAISPFGGYPSSSTVYWSGANPAGMMFGQFGLAKPTMTDSVLYGCGKWTVCIHDAGGKGAGIRYAQILNAPDYSFASVPAPAHNLSFASALDPLGKGDIILDGTQTTLCLEVEPTVPSDTAAGTIAVYDNSGAVHLVSLSARPVFQVDGVGPLRKTSSTVFDFGPTSVDTPGHGSILINNPTAAGARDLEFVSLEINADTTHFKFDRTIGPFPVTISRGTSLEIPIKFLPDDTTDFAASLTLVDECGRRYTYTIQGVGMGGLLLASDATFAQTTSGDTSCVDITVRNVGTELLTITGDPTVDDTTSFSIDPQFLSTLPRTIPPSDTLVVRTCFHPRDGLAHMGHIAWHTELPATLDKRMKTVSLLLGSGYDPDLVWSPASLLFSADSNAPSVRARTRVYLANRGSHKLLIHFVAIGGADSSEFRITDNEYGLTSLRDFYLAATDSLWIEVEFDPDIHTTYPARYRTRIAELVSAFEVDQIPGTPPNVIASLRAQFNQDASVKSFSDVVAPQVSARIVDRSLFVTMASQNDPPLRCTLFDLLGRVVGDWRFSPQSPGSDRFNLPQLPSGTYILRVSLAHSGLSVRLLK